MRKLGFSNLLPPPTALILGFVTAERDGYRESLTVPTDLRQIEARYLRFMKGLK